MLNNDGNQIAVDHPLVVSLANTIQRFGLQGEIRAMTAACDAWRYNNTLNIPTVVFGPGTLLHAHSKEEQIRLDDIFIAAEILLEFISTMEFQEV
jgi:acetylornithine deacetylase/succinyl-diaminopimelate desuccinylase-like protein